MKKIYFLIALVIIYFVSVGYSAFETNLLVDNVRVVVRPEKIVRVTNVDSPVAANGAIISDTDFNVDNINGNIVLPNSNSTVTYMVTVTNIGNTDVGILNASVSANGLDNILEANIDSNDYEVGNKLCNTSNVCNGGISKSFRVTIKYKNGASIINEDINFIVTFDFENYYTITYSGFNDTSGLISGMLAGEAKTITFNSTTGIPDNVSVVGASSSYTSPNLIISDVTDNVTITGTFGGETTDSYVYVANIGQFVLHSNPIPDTIAVYNTPSEVMASFYNSPFYFKHILENDIVKESYLDFIISSEMASENTGLKAGTYSLRGGINESELDSKPVFNANVNTLKEAFGENNYRCNFTDSSEVVCNATFNVSVSSDGTVSLYTYVAGDINDVVFCSVDSDGDSRCNV